MLGTVFLSWKYCVYGFDFGSSKENRTGTFQCGIVTIAHSSWKKARWQCIIASELSCVLHEATTVLFEVNIFPI